MPEKIGKYKIVERLGSGGMGTIFKAHDPVLDRLVALKVISTEVEITDELRARFFREAQACARLSHPNIVTVYAMGDDDGQLFIVMELLEGEELKHLIAQRKALALEDKLSIMIQVCDGLHYAHQNGVVHRDIKPGNIFRLRSGQVKILDFGIAQMANAEGGLTRTGLIMGSLRYISPEQVRGRVDHRSDIFSLGSVLYELLSMRPAFTGEDAMRLLEQLRTEEPPALEELDPTIPSELAAVVARAMRKDPAERFTDLEQMRSQLEEVQRGLTEEARRSSVRVRDQRGQLLQLRADLADRMGPSREEAPVPTLDEGARLSTIRALERDFSARIEALQARITRADSLAPAFRRATELLQAGQLAEAVGEFEAILAVMPDHAGALDGLERARAQIEVERRRLAAKLVQDARAALDAGGLALCLEILAQAAQIPPPAEAMEEFASLREAVEAAVAAREAVRRARQEAEGARARMEQARQAAQSQAGPQYALAVWNAAEVKSTEAATEFAGEAYVEARRSFEVAITEYRRFEEAAREAQRREHETAEQARSQAAQSRLRAQEAGAPQSAREQWDAAEARLTGAEAAFVRHAYAPAGQAFVAAAGAYRRAEEVAREAQERQAGERARAQMAQARERARAAGAPQYTQDLWAAAEAKVAEAQAADVTNALSRAAGILEECVILYGRAEEASREAREAERRGAEAARARATRGVGEATAAGAPGHAAFHWNEAAAKFAAAEAAFSQEQYVTAADAFDRALGLYQEAEKHARETRRRQREQAEQTRDATADEPTILQSERTPDSSSVLAEPTVALTAQVETPTGFAEPAGLIEASTVFDRPPPAGADVRKPAPGSSWGLRRVTLAAAGGFAVIGLGALLWLPRAPSTGPGPVPPLTQGQSGSPTSTASRVVAEDSQRAQQPDRAESAAGRPGATPTPQLERATDPSLLPSAPRIVDSPLTPRQALHEVFEGRNPGHSVTATVVKDTVRIGRDNLGFSITSSRPGYVYVMVVRSYGSDVELLLPNAVERNNYIEPGRRLNLPGPRWPLKAEGPSGTNQFLAIVSDEPRDFSALGPSSEHAFKRFRLAGPPLDRGPSGSPPLFAGTVACASAPRCSGSYGAVVFSIDTVAREPEARDAARRPPAATPPTKRALHQVSPRCSDILERASLGDVLTGEEQTILTRDCR